MPQLLQISEPENNIEEYAIGIDFGTTNSCACLSLEGRSTTPISKLRLIPSTVSTNLEIGNLESCVISSIKRILGKSAEQVAQMKNDLPFKDRLLLAEGQVKLKVGNRFLTPVEVSALIFKYIKQQAEKDFACSIKKAVVTVPAYFDNLAKSAVKDAAELAGIEVIRLLQEPTAAGLAYGINYKNSGQYLVYDLGGGTFDASLLNLQGKVIQVIAVGGDSHLGGDDVDLAIVKFFKQKGQELTTKQARSLKEALENSTKDSITLDGITLAKADYEQIALPIIKKTITIARDLVEKTTEPQGIILVGGASRSYLVRRELRIFNLPILCDIDPDKVVALGAALQAENLSRSKKHVLIDVVPISLGLEVMGGVNEKIIPANTPIPISVKKYFTTQAHGQSSISFKIVQGEDELASGCKEIGYFELSNISIKPAGLAQIEVNFMIDADGLLYITAAERNGYAAQELIIQAIN